MADFPKPLWADYPDGGEPIDRFEFRGCDHYTEHEDGTLRVWRGFLPMLTWDGEAFVRPPVHLPYYPIDPTGMSEDEVERAVSVALRLLDMPHNRKARRHPMLRHLDG